MYRKGDLIAPPWQDPTATSWRVYADSLLDCGPSRQREYLQAVRYTLGLTRRPKLVLVADLLPGGWPTTDLGWHRDRWSQGWWDGEGAYFRSWRWWTPEYARHFFAPVARQPVTVATPADFPGMTDVRITLPGGTEMENTLGRQLCLAFHYKAAASVGKLRFRDGELVEEVRHGKGVTRVEITRPVNWEKESAHASR